MALRWHVWLLAAAKLAAGGGQRHLFADPTGPSADRPTGPLESVHGATFVINPPQRQREPVLAPDSNWEVAANISFNAYSAVVQEPSRTRVWYNLVSTPPHPLPPARHPTHTTHSPRLTCLTVNSAYSSITQSSPLPA
eukprot:COSAG06_NODE_1781_length_8407_cov_9.719427_8_plen_138_part_00